MPEARADVVRRGDDVREGLPERVPAHVWVFLAALLANVFAGQAATLGLPISLDRPLFLLALVLLALDPARDHVRWGWVHVVMAATVLWTAYSWLSTGTLADSPQAFALLDRIVVPFGMFVVGPLVFSTRARRALLLRTLCLLGVYLGLTAVFEMVPVPELVFPRAIADPALGIGFGRARGPFLASEPMGMATTLTMVASAMLAGISHGSWRVVAVLGGVLSAVAVVLCLTRSSWIGAALVLVLALRAVPALRDVQGRLAAAAVATGVLAVLAFPSTFATLDERASNSRSVYDRLNTNAAALRVVEAHPVAGLGWGRFREESPDWIRQSDIYPVTNVDIEIHNVFLSRAAETGIPGAVLWALVVLLGPVAVLASRHRRDRDMQTWRLFCGCALLVWLVPTLTSPNPYPFPNNLVWLIAGIAGRELLVRPRQETR